MGKRNKDDGGVGLWDGKTGGRDGHNVIFLDYIFTPTVFIETKTPHFRLVLRSLLFGYDLSVEC
jgi:hypothetical protein